MNLINKSIYTIVLTLFISTNSFADCSYELFSISSTKNTKIINFIEELSDTCEFTVIVTDSNAEKILEKKLNKTHINNLTIEEVFNIILEENNLSYTLKNNLLKISYLTTKVFNVDYILSVRKGIGSTDVILSSSANKSSGSSGGAATSSSSSGSGGGSNGADSGIKIESTDEVIFWTNLDKELRSILNRPEDTYLARAPIINKNAGLITVTATSKQLKRLKDYLNKLQKKIQLQVLIDVQLLTVKMSEGKTTGIDWQQLYALQNINLSVDLVSSNNAAAFTPVGALTSLTANTNEASLLQVNTSSLSLSEVIKFLKTQGDVNSISNPKVLTLNNQPALITAGTEYFYKIKNTETLSNGSTGTQASGENVESVFAGVLLDITPEISNNDTITLKINPSLSETTSDLSSQSSAERTMPPDLVRRQLSSVVTVKDGHRIILGGLINTKNVNNSNKVPLLGDIPVLNYLFKYESNSKQVEELVIIIEPHIIHKTTKKLSLSDLGYVGINEDSVRLNRTSTLLDKATILKDKKAIPNKEN